MTRNRWSEPVSDLVGPGTDFNLREARQRATMANRCRGGSCRLAGTG